MRNRRERPPAEVKRRKARRDARAQQDAHAYKVGDRAVGLDGKLQRCVGTGVGEDLGRAWSVMTPGEVIANVSDGVREQLRATKFDRVLAALDAWRPLVRPAYRGGPRQIKDPTLLRAPAQPKPRALRSPTWLRLVRMMPCGRCGRGRPFDLQLSLALGSQSEANHHPSRGREAGGSDFETHPACSACHQVISENKIRDADLEQLVGIAQRTIFIAVREGRLGIEVLLACAVEAMLEG